MAVALMAGRGGMMCQDQLSGAKTKNTVVSCPLYTMQTSFIRSSLCFVTQKQPALLHSFLLRSFLDSLEELSSSSVLMYTVQLPTIEFNPIASTTSVPHKMSSCWGQTMYQRPSKLPPTASWQLAHSGCLCMQGEEADQSECCTCSWECTYSCH